MLQKRLFKYSAFMVMVAALALSSGCANGGSHSDTTVNPPAGATANPQTTLKKQSGGT